ncbi:MAG: hypothetical protein WD894_04135 [Pirellulales bacterium]
MLNRKVLGTGLCVAALGWSAARLYGEVMFVPDPSVQCADGDCVPRRMTNGYFQTKWRKWPVERPSRAQAGVQPGIAAPPVDLPAPGEETRLPEGAIVAPRPQEGQGAAPDTDTAPRPDPTAPPLDRGAPGAEPRPDLPPALRNQIPPPSFDDQGSRLPPDHRSPRRIPAMASRGRSRPATMVEALRDEATWAPVDQAHRAPESRIPGILPSDDAGNAEPLPKPPVEAAPRQPVPNLHNKTATRAGFSRDAFAYSDQRADWIEQAANGGNRQRGSVPGDRYEHGEESPTADSSDQSRDDVYSAPSHVAPTSTRLGARLSALRQSSLESDDAAEWPELDQRETPVDESNLDATQALASRSSLRLSPAGLNTPAVVGTRQESAGVRRTPAVADLTISTRDSSAVLAVRTVGDDGWGRSAPTGNPLRGGSKITRVVFETAEANEFTDKAAASDSALEASTSNFAVPANPLR